jgi:hypothetical protein
VACLMRVLTKPDLENAILVKELIVIMENFGIVDDEGEAEALEEHEIENSNEKDRPSTQESKPKKKKKKGG